jgi:hypothetical protein
MKTKSNNIKREEKFEAATNKSLDSRLGPHLENVGKLVKQLISEDETLVRKNDIQNLPTKDEFFTKMDELLTEVKTSREEQSLLSGRFSIHSDQIEEVQKHLGISTSY